MLLSFGLYLIISILLAKLYLHSNKFLSQFHTCAVVLDSVISFLSTSTVPSGLSEAAVELLVVDCVFKFPLSPLIISTN